jgi:hypothetical protein
MDVPPFVDGCKPLKNVASGKPRFPRNALKKVRMTYSSLHMDGVQISGLLHDNYSLAAYAMQLKTAIFQHPVSWPEGSGS